jgi:hypothetical protein
MMAKQRSLHLEVIILELIATSVIFKWDIHTNIYMITYLYASILICTRMHINTDVYITPEIIPTTFDTRVDPTNRYICIYMCIYIYIQACTYAHIEYKYIYMYTYGHIGMQIGPVSFQEDNISDIIVIMTIDHKSRI